MSQNANHIDSPQTGTMVYLVRHGLTEWNRQKRFQGHIEIPLNDEGRRQSEAVGRWLARQPVRFTALYCSDLERALQTAQLIGERLNLSPAPNPALREIHCGDWQGLSVEEIEAKYPGQLLAWRERVDKFKLPGGESIPEVQERIFAFYTEVVRKHPGEAIVLVSHGAALSALQAAVQGWDLVETWHTKRARLGNTGVTAIAVDNQSGKATVVITNSCEHLPDPTGMSSVIDPA